MLAHITDFFRYMSDNKEHRLYYVLPVQREAPYAYQHSSIRDIATVCDILDLVYKFPPDARTVALFETVTRNTLRSYTGINDFVDGNIGDVGLFLLLLEKCRRVFPSILPDDWQEKKTALIRFLHERQNRDGSLRIFFDPLWPHEKSGEAFYLPEALIGLIGAGQSEEVVRKGVDYCCQEERRKHHLAAEDATFYVNWQFQLLYHWLQKRHPAPLEITHLEKLVQGVKGLPIAHEPFRAQVATVEVACYLEGLVYARATLAHMHKSLHPEWFDAEIERSIRFLHTIQSKPLQGGFAHSLMSDEARIDVAGHVFSALSLL